MKTIEILNKTIGWLVPIKIVMFIFIAIGSIRFNVKLSLGEMLLTSWTVAFIIISAISLIWIWRKYKSLGKT